MKPQQEDSQEMIPLLQTQSSSTPRALTKIINSNLLTFLIYPYLNEHELINCAQIHKKWNCSSDHPTIWYRRCQQRNMKIAKINSISFTNWNKFINKFNNNKKI
jgi:hypothetical protein